MSAKEVGLNSQESIVLKSLVGTGVAVFSLFMLMNWQKTLSEAKVAQQAQEASQPVATQESSTPSSAIPRQAEPIVESTTPTTSENSITTTPVENSVITLENSTEPTVSTSTEASAENTINSDASGALVNSNIETTPETNSVTSLSVETPEVAAITDPGLVQSLNQQLYTQVDQAWQQTPSFSDNLVYKVQVKENGEIAEYTPLNEAAANYLSEVPIDELQKDSTSFSEKVVDFLVVLTPSGRLQVNPWTGKN
ncbi:MAG: hypothetical protein SWJ54_01645 [Cyanobacteriota bacterium]|nr:hypothetical protein [Cyanobacteriota bacterium]